MHSDVALLLHRLEGQPDGIAVIAGDLEWTRADLLRRVRDWRCELAGLRVAPGDTVAMIGSFSAGSISLLLALAANSNIAVPLSNSDSRTPGLARVAHAGYVVEFGPDDRASWTCLPASTPPYPLVDQLRRSGEPGLIVFTSASTGPSKGAVHSFARLLTKFRRPRPARRTLTFLTLDHLGGINTLLSALSYGGVAITTGERTVDGISSLIARRRVELLPATPTFLKMLLMADAPARYDFSSLKLITYGTEPMAAASLKTLREMLPGVRLKQTYGLTELGVLPTRSENEDSLWMQVGGEGFETRVADGTLRVRAATAMLGYLNAPSPFDSEGWYDTGDVVETKPGYFRIVGRRSEVINVAGDKVFPEEVEDFLLTLENVADATVSAMPNPLTGQLLVAAVRVRNPEEPAAAEARILAACSRNLAPHKVPVTVRFMADSAVGERFKRNRTQAAAGGAG